MGYNFWKSRFAGDPHVIGKVLTLDGTPRTVIGVMPPRFIFWSADVWIPTALRRDTGFQPPWYELLGRLKDGIAPGAAQRQIEMVAHGIAHKYASSIQRALTSVWRALPILRWAGSGSRCMRCWGRWVWF